MQIFLLTITILFSTQTETSIIHFLNNSTNTILVSDHCTKAAIILPNEEKDFELNFTDSLFFYLPRTQNSSQANLFDLKWTLQDLDASGQEVTISYLNLMMPKKLEFLYPKRFVVTKVEKSKFRHLSETKDGQAEGLNKNKAEDGSRLSTKNRTEDGSSVYAKATPYRLHSHLSAKESERSEIRRLERRHTENQNKLSKKESNKKRDDYQKTWSDNANMSVIVALAKQVKMMHQSSPFDSNVFKSMHDAKRKK